MMVQVQEMTKTFIDRIKEFFANFDLGSWLESIGIPYTLPVQAALCFGTGFAIGFLFKKFFKTFFFGFILAILLIKFLEYQNVLIIDWQAVYSMFGIAPGADTQAVIQGLFGWIKENIVVFLATLIGFLLGCKLG
jgi:uncharacterized membrane protein (Fun14 family)